MRARARISRDLPQPVRREREGMSSAHEEHIRCCPCLVCGKPPRNDPHHLQRGLPANERGTGRRASDQWLIPLCRTCHTWAEATGNDDERLASVGIDGRAIARVLWSHRGSLASIVRVVVRSLQGRGIHV